MSIIKKVPRGLNGPQGQAGLLDDKLEDHPVKVVVAGFSNTICFPETDILQGNGRDQEQNLIDQFRHPREGDDIVPGCNSAAPMVPRWISRLPAAEMWKPLGDHPVKAQPLLLRKIPALIEPVIWKVSNDPLGNDLASGAFTDSEYPSPVTLLDSLSED